MSGSASSYLSVLYSSMSSASSNSLLQIIYGGGTASASGGGDPIAALRSAEINRTTDIAQTAQQPSVARDIAAFKAAVASAKSPADLLANPAALKVLMTANGLADQLSYTALATKALLSDTNSDTSLASKLPDTRWKSVAQTYDFANKGLSVIQNPSVVETISNAYAEVTWRQSLDATTPGLSNALTFRSEASTITSVDQILGDPTMRTVVTTALGIPEQIAFQDLPAQEQAISSRLDITRFRDPAFVESFTQRYLIAAGQAASQSATGSTDITSLAVQSAGLLV
jgi:hypothetical protein